jgi:hypothetical protein
MRSPIHYLLSLALGFIASTGRAGDTLSARFDEVVFFGGQETRIQLTIKGPPASTVTFQVRLIQVSGDLAALLSQQQRTVTLDSSGTGVTGIALEMPKVRAVTTCQLLIFGADLQTDVPAKIGGGKLTVIPSDLWKKAAEEWRELLVFGDTEQAIKILTAASVPFTPMPGMPAKLRDGATYLGVLPLGADARMLLRGKPVGHLVMVVTGIRSPLGWISFESHNGATRSVVALSTPDAMSDASTQLALTRALRAGSTPDFTSPLWEMLQIDSQP